MILHILEPRWTAERVLDYMKCLYMNSELFVVSERLRFFSRTAWRGLVFMEGRRRILLGDNPILVGSRVSDLRTEEGESAGEQIVRWTQPAGMHRSPPNSEIEYLRKPVERVFRISAYRGVFEITRIA